MVTVGNLCNMDRVKLINYQLSLSIRVMLKLIPLGDGLHRTLSMKLFQVMQRQLTPSLTRFTLLWLSSLNELIVWGTRYT